MYKAVRDDAQYEKTVAAQAGSERHGHEVSSRSISAGTESPGPARPPLSCGHTARRWRAPGEGLTVLQQVRGETINTMTWAGLPTKAWSSRIRDIG